MRHRKAQAVLEVDGKSCVISMMRVRMEPTEVLTVRFVRTEVTIFVTTSMWDAGLDCRPSPGVSLYYAHHCRCCSTDHFQGHDGPERCKGAGEGFEGY